MNKKSFIKNSLVTCTILLFITTTLIIGVTPFLLSSKLQETVIKWVTSIPYFPYNSVVNEKKEISQEHVKIMDQVSGIRQINYNLDHIEFEFINKSDVIEIINGLEVNPDKTQQDENSILFWKALGGYPDNADIKAIIDSYLTSNVLGFYYPKDSQFYIISENSELTPSNKATFAHEFTHFLQNEKYNIAELDEKYSPYIEGQEDLYQAYSAILEGDATLTTSLYIKTLSTSERNKLYKDIEAPDNSQIPDIIIKSMNYQYDKGTEFVLKSYSNNDFSKIDSIMNDIPKSTEQILHPEKYYSSNRDEPTNLTIPLEIISELGNTYPQYSKYLSNYCIGELDTRILLEEFITISEAQKASEGWDGNSTAFFYNNETSEYLILFYYTFDSTKDKNEFDTIFEKYIVNSGNQKEMIYSSNNQADSIYLISGEISN